MVQAIAVLLLLGLSLSAQTPEASWLDRPLKNWNVPGRALPRAVPNGETIAEISKRCAHAVVDEHIRRAGAGRRRMASLPHVRSTDRAARCRDRRWPGGSRRHVPSDSVQRLRLRQGTVGRNTLARPTWTRAPTAASAAGFGSPKTRRSPPSSPAIPASIPSVVLRGVSPSDTESTATASPPVVVPVSSAADAAIVGDGENLAE